MKIRKLFEIALIKLARNILINRNVERSEVVSRKDNNEMWRMAEKLDAICKRMQDEYQNT